MGTVVGGAATSHAFALEDPKTWDAARERVRQFYFRKYGALPPESERTKTETDDDVQRRYKNITDAHAHIRKRLLELKPDAIVMIADDQDEIFTEENYPQIAIYVGEDFVCRGRHQPTDLAGRNHVKLAHEILREAVENDIDMAVVGTLRDNVLGAHAFGPVIHRIDPGATIPVVPIFVNAIHTPAPSPARCYYLGQIVAQAVRKSTSVERVVVVGSGGLSHFPGSYPGYPKGDFPFGAIIEKFDRAAIDLMQKGRGSELAKLTNQQLLENGAIEHRGWISTLGAIGDQTPEVLVYEPLYRAIMGMSVGFWSTNGAKVGGAARETARA